MLGIIHATFVTGEGFDGSSSSPNFKSGKHSRSEQDNDYFEQQKAKEKAARDRWQREQAAVWVFAANPSEHQTGVGPKESWTYGWKRSRHSCCPGQKQRIHRGWVTRAEQSESTQVRSTAQLLEGDLLTRNEVAILRRSRPIRHLVTPTCGPDPIRPNPFECSLPSLISDKVLLVPLFCSRIHTQTVLLRTRMLDGQNFIVMWLWTSC